MGDSGYVAGAGVVGLYGGEKVVGVVRRNSLRHVRNPIVAGEIAVFAQIHESHDVAGVFVAVGFVGNPDLDAGDVYA